MLQSISNQSEFLLPFGNYSWPFRGRLGHPLPPSIEQTTSLDPYIRYFVKVELVRPNLYKRYIEKEFPIVVQYYSTYPVNVTRVEEKSETRNGARIHVTLQKNVVAAGNNLIFNINLLNQQQAVILGISATLVQIWKIGSSTVQRIDLLDYELEDFELFQGKRFNKSFELPVARRVAPTCSFELPSSPAETPLNLYYELMITALFGKVSMDMEFGLPVIVTNAIEKTIDGRLPPHNNASFS
ncbi:unnamed protein product [Rotaria sp. Silwood2]|nr:unnamed protein product [Rotaria sp. Silwood2]CAF4155726.1 unnamed protein product [Rotaria sp. Silwood2]